MQSIIQRLLYCYKTTVLFVVTCTVLFSTFFADPIQAADNLSNERSFLRIAVAANFKTTLEQLIPAFSQNTGVTVQLVSASTGVLFQQLSHGAPFDLFLAADVARPKKLIELGLALPTSSKTYALGQLALWIKSSELSIQSWQQFVQWLSTKSQNSLTNYYFAIANPSLAPYGKAAKQLLTQQNLWSLLQPRLILGQNINQTFQQLSTGAVDFGFIALSQAKQHNISVISVPTNAYTAITQQLVIMKNSRHKHDAKLFTEFLLSAKIQQKLIAQGYQTIIQSESKQEAANGF